MRDELISTEGEYVRLVRQMSNHGAGLLSWTNGQLRELAALEGVGEHMLPKLQVLLIQQHPGATSIWACHGAA